MSLDGSSVQFQSEEKLQVELGLIPRRSVNKHQTTSVNAAIMRVCGVGCSGVNTRLLLRVRHNASLE